MKSINDYNQLIMSYLITRLFGKQVFTFNRSRNLDSVNDFKKSQSLLNFGDTFIYGEHYTLKIGWNFSPEILGEKDNLSSAFIGINFINLLNDSGMVAFNEMIRDLEEYESQFVVRDNLTTLEQITKFAKSCDQFCIPQLLEDTGIAVIDRESEKLRSSHYFNYGEFLDSTLPLNIFNQYLSLGEKDILPFIRKHDFIDIIHSSEKYFNLSFNDILITNSVIQEIAKNFKSQKISFNNCVISGDADFSPLSDRDLMFHHMDVKIYQLYSLTGSLVLSRCNIDTTPGIFSQLKLSELCFNHCCADLKPLFLRFNAPNLEQLTISEDAQILDEALTMLPDFSPNLTAIDISGDLASFNFLLRLLKLQQIVINYNDRACPLIITSSNNQEQLRRNNADAIELYCKEHRVEDIADELLPYFERSRIVKLLSFYQKIVVNADDYNELIKYPDIYYYIMSKEATNLNRGYHLYNGFMNYYSNNFEGIDFDTFESSNERQLVRVGNMLGSKLKYLDDKYQPIFLGIGPLIYASDGRPIIFQKCPYTGKYYTEQSRDPVYSMVQSEVLEGVFDYYTTPFNYQYEDDKYCERSITQIEAIAGAHLIDIYSKDDVKKIADYISANYSDSMPEFTRCWNEYYRLLSSELPENPLLQQSCEEFLSATSLFHKTVYEHLNQLSISEIYYIYDKFRRFLGDNFSSIIILLGLKKYNIQTDLSAVDPDNINRILNINLDDCLAKLDEMASEKSRLEHERVDRDVIIPEAAILEILNLPKNNPNPEQRILVLKKE